MSEFHSIISPSGASRWLNCGKSIELDLERNVPDSSGADADLGTAAHALFEICVKGGFKSPHAFIDEPIEVNGQFKFVDLNMANAVEVAVDYCRDLLIKTKNADHFSECRVEVKELSHPKDTQPAGGTVDWYCVNEDHLHVLDYKHGQGVLVEVENNEQMMLYAIGVLRKLNPLWPATARIVSTVTLHIVQPRASHPDGPCRSWQVPWPVLAEFRAKVETQVKAICTGQSTYGPTEKGCRWCDHKATCPGLTKKVFEVAKQDFQQFLDAKPPAPQTDDQITSEQLAGAFPWLKLIGDWAAAVQGEIVKRVANEDPVLIQHFKIVAGKANRQWKNEETVKEQFKLAGVDIDKYAPRHLVGIGEGEMLIKKPEREAFMKANAVKPEGKPTLALITDPRPALKTAAQAFKDHIQ